MVWPGEELIFDRTKADVENRTEKGFLMCRDLSRMGRCAKSLIDFAGLRLSPKTDWAQGTFPTAARLKDFLTALKKLREQFPVRKTTPELPETMAGLTAEEANAMEKMLFDMCVLREMMPGAWRYSGEIRCGEE